ncbi:YaaC family protein [Neotabrizicola shimadae]|uniref:Uncharacterized protein n=1 Tax=Neotabrizicola shimadae TaxID=2807096 RepID=A0A8G0ZQW2_9RHOB|nr:hypothetical protein [Neotabrizicola shimadae]QYZ68372.1 hypothetical protein JO391_11285 [Neotabrizicola shimadae]
MVKWVVWEITKVLEGILDDTVEVVPGENEPLFALEPDFDEVVLNHRKAAAEYKSAREKKETQENISEWMMRCGVADPKSPDFRAAQNFSRLKNEVSARIAQGSRLQLIGVDISDLERSLYELSESIENVALIQEIYRVRKHTVAADGGINAAEAAKIKHCFSQGRELYRSGTVGSLVVKPLNYFYALTAYAYGIIILNNPIRFRKDMLPGSHGINYLPDRVLVQFGGDMPRGTFSDLHTSFPQAYIKSPDFEIAYSQLDSALALYKNRITCSLGTLLSMVPEMGDFYQIATGRQSRVHQLKILPSKQVKEPSPTFVIGDGSRRPSRASVERCFPGMELQEIRGEYHITVRPESLHKVNATIYTDIYADLWFIETPFGDVNLPEVCLHFLILSMFSNIMRYRPDEWGGLVDNDVSASVSLATRHYFNVIERKLNALVLREASTFFPFAPR